MKRLIFLFLIILGCSSGALAQKGLAINQLFDGRYRKDPQAVETTLRGTMLDKYYLTLYRSISITDRPEDAESIEKLLTKDAKLAIDSEVSNRKGKLYYAFYRLAGTDPNRYILYLNQQAAGGNKIILMYLEGSASTKEVKKMFNHK